MLSGAFVGPIMATAKILFSLLCTFLDDWTTPLKDEELKTQYLDFLTALASRYHDLQPWPRLIIPNGNTAVAMHLHGDGSVYLASAVLYPVSAKLRSDTDQVWCASDAYSVMVDAVKHHSVPVCEALGMLEGSTLAAAFIGDNYHHFSSNFPITLNIGSDSTCTLHVLR